MIHAMLLLKKSVDSSDSSKSAVICICSIIVSNKLQYPGI